MRLSDNEVLELNELCSAAIDETLTEEGRTRLGELLKESEEARRFYVQATGLSASLFYYAGEMQTEPREGEPAAKPRLRYRWVTGSLIAAASMILAFWIATTRQVNTVRGSETEPEFVARLTGSKGCVWKGPAIAGSGRISQGQMIELANGLAEITFDSGARVLVQGPAALVVNSAWSATLNRGTVKATVPPQAVGFSVANGTVKVVDLGTEFVMSADSAGRADVLVLKGKVEATPHTSTDQQPQVLSANESARFASSGVSAIPDSASQITAWARPVTLDRFTSPVHYAHWSFDEMEGAYFSGDAVGIPFDVSSAQILGEPASGLAGLHVRGRWGGALEFNGHSYAKIPLQSISENSPHTVAFWVKIPKDASLSNAYAMVAWSPNRKALGSHPIHISWNRNPDEGVVGVLRTDYGRGFAIGATPLRDNRWHHIAVVFIPPDNPQNFMEVKQYVDGHLEGEGNLSPSGSDVFNKTDASDPASTGALWLGCRLGVRNVRTERFQGAIDELFVAERPLEPQEIVQLMTNNRF